MTPELHDLVVCLECGAVACFSVVRQTSKNGLYLLCPVCQKPLREK